MSAIKSLKDDSLQSDLNDVKQEAGYDGTGIIVKVHHINNYSPATSAFVQATIYQGAKVVRTIDKIEC